MVSFCDLRLSELKGHMGNYGCYGIGLTKKWANNKGLNPVLYMNKYSSVTNNFLKGIDGLRDHIYYGKNDDLIDSDVYPNIINIFRYTKNYQGDLERLGKKTIKNFRFADEREWRYVPSFESVSPQFVVGTKDELSAMKPRLNAECIDHRLTFTPDDIRYLVIKNEEERLELLDHLELVKRVFDDNTRRRLASRILTADQIHNDV